MGTNVEVKDAYSLPGRTFNQFNNWFSVQGIQGRSNNRINDIDILTNQFHHINPKNTEEKS